MLDKVLIANRARSRCGSCAPAVSRHQDRRVHSTADRNLKHVLLADETVCIGPPPRATATSTCRDHQRRRGDRLGRDPSGYGFLSENADFAERVEKRRLHLRRAAAETIRLMATRSRDQVDEGGGRAVRARSTGRRHRPEDIIRIARDIGYPVIIKASGGGGGRACASCTARRP